MLCNNTPNISYFTVCSSEVSVMNRRNSSLPDDTDTADFSAEISSSVADLISSLNLDTVPAVESKNVMP